ncbi:MAG TPA: L7Ae/L30e/S12e/Gadd45 family ribosomal protein [Gemmatimonadaceae bacterium]
MDVGTEQRVLRLVGLGLRARNAVVGVEQVRQAARRGRLRLVVVAPDASHHSRDKLLPLLFARGVRVVEGPSASALGAAVGRQATAAVGITDADLARGVRAAISGAGERLEQNGRARTRTPGRGR